MAFFATGDSIVSNNLVLNLYKHINSPEARLYLSRQLSEEAVHVQFYLTLLDNYVPEADARAAAFAAMENIPSIAKKAEFCMKWIDSIQELDRIETRAQRREFLLNLICFASCIEGLFFFGAFAYVYFFRSKGLLHGLAAGTNWVFRDESCHIDFAYEVVRIVRSQEPDLWDAEFEKQIVQMLADAIDAEASCQGSAFGRRCRALDSRDAPISWLCGRLALAAARDRARIPLFQSVSIHGASGCAGTDELLRAPRSLRLSGICARRSRVQRGFLVAEPDLGKE